jgi:hypothetical protein
MKSITLELHDNPLRYRVLSVTGQSLQALRYEIVSLTGDWLGEEGITGNWLGEEGVRRLCADPSWTVHCVLMHSSIQQLLLRVTCLQHGHHAISWRDENGGSHSYCDRCSRWLCCNGEQIGFR